MYIYNKRRRTKLTLCWHVNIPAEIQIKNIHIARTVLSRTLRERQLLIVHGLRDVRSDRFFLRLLHSTTESTRVVDHCEQVNVNWTGENIFSRVSLFTQPIVVKMAYGRGRRRKTPLSGVTDLNRNLPSCIGDKVHWLNRRRVVCYRALKPKEIFNITPPSIVLHGNW